MATFISQVTADPAQAMQVQSIEVRQGVNVCTENHLD